MKLGYRPALDGLRAVAIAAVVLHHTGGLLPGGDLGVDLFFVLSGFLITTLLLEEHAERGSIWLRAFYRRRALRLLPALFVLLAIVLAISLTLTVATGRSPQKDLFGVAAGVGYFSNFAMAGEPGTRPMPEELRHLWSLAQEEQFYVVWPPLLLLLLGVRRRLAVMLLGGAILLTFARGLQLYADGASSARLSLGVDTRSLSILTGCLLAFVLAARHGPTLRRASWLQPLAVGGLLGFFLLQWERQLFVGPLLLFAACCALLIALALDERSLLARVLSVRPMVFLGKISYSLYLWHFPIFVVVGLNDERVDLGVLPALVTVAAAVACATASYYLVELPFLRRKRRRAAPTDLPVPRLVLHPRPAETGA